MNFPSYEDLSFEQKEAVNLPFDKKNLVIGAPGTGKTIVAIYRIHELSKNNVKRVLMLVFNRALYNYIVEVQKQLKMENEFEIYTVNDFVFYKLYCGDNENFYNDGIIKKPVPNINGEKYKTDWQQIYSDFSKKIDLYDHIVVDEGQDFNEYFYKTILNLTKYITIFADPNQAIQEDSTSLDKIMEIINKETYFALTLNYRNSRNIVNYTRQYCYDKSIFAESYIDKDDLEIIDFNENTYLENIKSIILKYDENTDIGIIVPHIKDANGNTTREYEIGVYEYLKSNLDSKYEVSIYYNEKTITDKVMLDRNRIDFRKKSIKIFNYKTVRGLDFDVVILINIFTNSFNKSNESDYIMQMNNMYIATTRAKEKIYVLRDNNNSVKEFSYDSITYSGYENIMGITLDECIKRARLLEEEEYYAGQTMYYYHYAVSVIGITDKELLKRALCSFANLCLNYNKPDFALGAIANYSYKYNEFNDNDLIYFYQNALLRSFNHKLVFDKLDKFFERIFLLSNNDDKDDLIEEFFHTYLLHCFEKDIEASVDFAKEYIQKYNFNNFDSYKNYLKMFDGNKKDDGKDNDVPMLDENTIDMLVGHNLISKFDSYIKIIADAKGTLDDCIKKAKRKKFIEKDFDWVTDYDKMVHNGLEDIRINSMRPIALIIGAIPHSVKGKGDSTSIVEKYNADGYPKVFRVSSAHRLTISEFSRTLDDISKYLRDILKDRKRVKEMWRKFKT